MNGHSDMVGMMESGEISHEDFEPPSFDEEKERRAGFHGTVCLNCQEDTGFGRGKEPMRYDIHW